jgi:hypothetical protein
MADTPPYPGLPSWVKVAGLIIGVLVLVVAIVIFTGIGGPHGPSRHLPSDGTDDQTRTEDGNK